MTGRQTALWIVNAVLLVGVAALTVFGGYELLMKSRPAPAALADRADLRQAVTDAAATSTAKILTYSPGTIEQDMAAGLAVTTGEFAEYYKDFTERIVMPAARQKNVTTTATVAQSGVISIDNPDTAAALVFVNQVTTSTENPDPNHQSSSVRVGMRKVDGQWRISSFDPQ
ncbi:hypothetical protein A5699_00095 [Mycobacterium sp. E802]|uniref:hypothetical protein n=1 Tax=Mycobacterium sp. E802 TaxID=1834152 RepID=UPI0007FEAB67|nr:hypothetical protein [Mycobacterium sp. E802]OBG83548.1 hypothetical protein A5699_00095 [Mycobacterium sp. E802]